MQLMLYPVITYNGAWLLPDSVSNGFDIYQKPYVDSLIDGMWIDGLHTWDEY